MVDRLRRRILAALVVTAVTAHLNWAFGQSPGNWTTRAPMSPSRTEVAVFDLGGRIYVIGGFAKSGDMVEGYDLQKNP